MKAPVLSRRLSGTDAAFLYLERKEIPLHIASVSIFDGPVPFERFVAGVDSKLHLLPRYTQVAVAPPFNLGYPVWEPDPNFDIRRHIFRTRLDPPGGEAELEALAGRILGELMDRGKPLWDIHIVEGMKDGRGALIARVHHALADGIAGEALMNIMFDPSPDVSAPRRKRRVRREVEQPARPSLVDAAASGVFSTIENLISAEARLCSVALDLASERMRNGLKGLVTLIPELAMSIERLPFNKPCGSERKFCWAEFDFSEVRAIRAAEGAKVNDVILTVLMRALARYARMHGQPVENRYVRVVCPVNVRTGEQGESLGNRISFMPVALPLGIEDPVGMLHAVGARTGIMKAARAADLLALAVTWLGAAPPPLQAALWRVLPDVPMPVPLLNMICTNVAGPQMPLYAAGRKMLASYPHVPTGYELGVNCAAQTYDGKLFYGFTADAHAAPDVGVLRDFLKLSFEELCIAAGVRKPARRGRSARAGKGTRPAKAALDGSPTSVSRATPAPRRRKAERSRAARPLRPDAGAPPGVAAGPPAPPPEPVAQEAGADETAALGMTAGAGA